VIVNTVVIVRNLLNGSQSDVAVALAAFGAGSMIAALMLPRILDRVADRPVMLTGGMWLALLLAIFALVISATGVAATWTSLLAVWLGLGLGYSAILTPTGRLLRRSAHAADRPALFAAQFALSHACWLVTYLAAGWLGQSVGMRAALIAIALGTALGVILAAFMWPVNDPAEVFHEHTDLPVDHPHLAKARGRRHAHPFVIDDLHPNWPHGHR
jgi:MFS family permease